MAGGLQDWWNRQGATLGLEWLASVLTVASTPTSTFISNHATTGDARMEEEVPTRRRGGRSGHVPKPRSVRAALVSVDVDLTDPM
jgi:hypothetical protein